MSKELETELSHHFKGLKRTSASSAASGAVSCKVGKDPMPFGLYRFLCRYMLLSSQRDCIFARTFLIVCWNLMCRAANAFAIAFSHMACVEDSLCVYFAQMKNDQFGEKPRDPRHVYSNPLIPEICPFLALGIYFLCYGFNPNQTQLFAGSSQYDRFRKVLNRVCDHPEVLQHLREIGLLKEDIGSHSIRKGSATYCSSGSTACPSSTSVHLRAGWTLGGVQDTYLRYEAAGDMYVGRTVCGLPLTSPSFAILPPHFEDCDDSIVKDAMTLCFPYMPPCLYGVCQAGLASVVYHEDFIRRNLPNNHLIFQSAPFRNHDMLARLKQMVICGLPDTSQRISASGIPPHVSILLEMQLLSEKMVQNILHQQQNVQDVISGITQELENRAIGAGTVTREGLRQSILHCFNDSGVTELLDKLRNNSVELHGNDMAPAAGSPNLNSNLYLWGNAMHPVPEDFQIPTTNIVNAWVLWCCGNVTLKYPPYRQLVPLDMSTRSKRKRLSSYRGLMLQLEHQAKSALVWKSQPTEQQCIEIFNSCKQAIEIPERSEHNRKRRMNQLAWCSVETILRKRRRQAVE